MANVLNFNDQGGARTEIGGELEILDTATVTLGGTEYTGAAFKAIVAAIAALPTENVASPGIWNDAGVLKVGSV